MQGMRECKMKWERSYFRGAYRDAQRRFVIRVSQLHDSQLRGRECCDN